MDIRALAMGLAFALMWSSAFTSARIIVAHAPPLGISAIRFLIAGLVAVAIARFLGQSWRLTTSQARATVIFGICQNALYLGLFFVAMQTIEASMAAIIASTMPLLVALAGLAIFGERVRPLGIVGLAVGFAGVALIMGSRLQGGGVDPWGVAYCVIGVLALTFATLAVRGASSGGNVLMIVGLQMLVGAAVLAPASLLLEEWRIDWSPEFVLAFAYTVIVPGLVATLTWFLLVQRIGAVKAATFHFLNPFFGVAIAALLLGERLGPWDVVGVGVIMLGILAVQLSRQPVTDPTRK
ncbi:DMT family transporter [Tropicimonas sp. TH_r6]|uniref:DMT family transporter n=1 Tax=Tropicimonas sp. TH_r6 TaxID=3082085 RepID=UPI002954F8E2|nr:DMT family transporter [Tropicimonas sp. TH_r6]MDV7141188.1 DMT family transporter [Tropicimonas sp. TH_r6]